MSGSLFASEKDGTLSLTVDSKGKEQANLLANNSIAGITSIVPDDGGNLLIAGRGLWRILPGQSVDPAFESVRNASRMDAKVALQAEKILVLGGSYGLDSGKLVRLTGSGNVDATFSVPEIRVHPSAK